MPVEYDAQSNGLQAGSSAGREPASAYPSAQIALAQPTEMNAHIDATLQQRLHYVFEGALQRSQRLWPGIAAAAAATKGRLRGCLWPFVGAIITLGLGLVAVPPAYEAILLAKWTALKDFREQCLDTKQVRDRSGACDAVMNEPLPPPPGVNVHKRMGRLFKRMPNLDAWDAEAATQGSVRTAVVRTMVLCMLCALLLMLWIRILQSSPIDDGGLQDVNTYLQRSLTDKEKAYNDLLLAKSIRDAELSHLQRAYDRLEKMSGAVAQARRGLDENASGERGAMTREETHDRRRERERLRRESLYETHGRRRHSERLRRESLYETDRLRERLNPTVGHERRRKSVMVTVAHEGAAPGHIDSSPPGEVLEERNVSRTDPERPRRKTRSARSDKAWSSSVASYDDFQDGFQHQRVQ